jgi:hypothetical protein
VTDAVRRVVRSRHLISAATGGFRAEYKRTPTGCEPL